jgi:hypothetical protein
VLIALVALFLSLVGRFAAARTHTHAHPPLPRFLYFHTGSLFLASCGMFHVVFSFPVAIFVNRKVFSIQFFGT